MVINFAGQWLQLRDLAEADKDTEVYPAWKDEHLELFRQETERFVELVWKGDARLDTLLTAPFSVLNAELAALYGVKGVTGTELRKVDLDPEPAGGRADPGQLPGGQGRARTRARPSTAGVFVREQMFCQALPPPPPEANAMPPAARPEDDHQGAVRRPPGRPRLRQLPQPDRQHRLRVRATTTRMGVWRTHARTASRSTPRASCSAPTSTASSRAPSSWARSWWPASRSRPAWSPTCSTSASDASRRTPTSAPCRRWKALRRSGGDLRALLLALVQTDAFFFKGGLLMKTMSRRTLLRGAGGRGHRPALPGRHGAPARPGPRTRPCRAGCSCMLNQNGVVPGTWFPTGGEKDFKLAASMASLEPLREHLIILDGITQDGAGHRRTAPPTGAATPAPSPAGPPAATERHRRRRLASIRWWPTPSAARSRVKSLMTGRVYQLPLPARRRPARCTSGRARPEEELRPPVHRLHPAHRRRRQPDPGATADLARLRARKKSILDAAMEQYRKVAQSRGPRRPAAAGEAPVGHPPGRDRADNAGGAPTSAAQGCTKPRRADHQRPTTR